MTGDRSVSRCRQVVYLVLCISLAAVPVGASASSQGGDSWTAGTSLAPPSAPGLTQAISIDRTPFRPGRIRVAAIHEVGPDVAALVITMPNRATVVRMKGFIETANGTGLAWDGRTPNPFVIVAISVNRSSARFGGFDAVDTGDWALIRTPALLTTYRSAETGRWHVAWDGTGRIDRSVRTVGPGYVSARLTYLGPYERHVYDANGQRFRFVVPAAASMTVPPDVVARSLAATSGRLRVGGADREVVIFVAPHPIRPGGAAYAGTRSGTQDVWVHEDMRLSHPNNVWVHEYVHTRQTFSTDAEMAWFVEASATYYAALAARNEGRISDARFLRYATTGEDATVVLTDRAAVRSANADYTKGVRVLAALDARIRLASGGRRSLLDVFRLVNGHRGRVTGVDFTRIVTETAGPETGEWLARIVRSTEGPPVPRNPALFGTPGPNGDPDADGLTTREEGTAGTDPFRADSDGDALSDGREIRRIGSNPLSGDSDGDGLEDGAEVADHRTDPTAADTDGDRLADGDEANRYRTDPLSEDSDGDRFHDGAEIRRLRTDPTRPTGFVDYWRARLHLRVSTLVGRVAGGPA